MVCDHVNDDDDDDGDDNDDNDYDYDNVDDINADSDDNIMMKLVPGPQRCLRHIDLTLHLKRGCFFLGLILYTFTKTAN